MNDAEKLAAMTAGAIAVGALITTATVVVVKKFMPSKAEELMMALADESPAAVTKAIKRIQKSA